MRIAFTRLLFVLLAIGLLAHSQLFAQDIGVSAELSASTITRDESVVLTITAIGIDAELDASSLAKDFDVVGRSSSRQISTVIGSNNQAVNTSVVPWALELLPKSEGVFTVPAVKVGDLQTQLLSLTVNAVPQGAKREIFLEASVDSDTPWVQSQVVMSLRVFQAIDIVDGGLDVPAADDLVVERIGEDIRTQEVRDGREYSVTERRFALFPQKSGTITIDPVTLSVTVPADPGRVRGYFSPTRKLTRASQAITLNVQARPPSGVAWWLPARRVGLQAQWQGDPQMAQVDQPLTRTIIMRAEGVLESQLPQINIPAIDGLSLYAEDPKLAMGATDSGLVSEQRINWALIPQRSGTLTLPAIRVEWFNTLTGKTETAELASQTIEVAAPVAGAPGNRGSTDASGVTPAENLSASTATGASDSRPAANIDSPAISSGPPTNGDLLAGNAADLNQRLDRLTSALQRWQLLALFAGLLWLATVVAWWFKRRQKASVTAVQQGLDGHQFAHLINKVAPMHQIEKAGKQGDLLNTKRALLEWCRHQWPIDTPNTLDALQARLPQGIAREKLARIQVALYSEQGYSNNMAALSDDLKTLADDLKTALQERASVDELHSAGLSEANNSAMAVKPGSRLPQL